MTDTLACGWGPNESTLRAEILRLNKILKALMDRAERSTNAQGSDFSLFQTTVMLQEQVRRRTEELEAALHEKSAIASALRQSEARFRGLVSQSLVGIVMIEEGKFTYSNSKFAEMLGYTPDEILHFGPLDISADCDRELVAEQMRKRLSGQADAAAYVFRGLRKNRVEIDVECHSSVMDIGANPVIITLLIDVTERARAEREVRALHDQLREQAIQDQLTGLYNRQPLAELFDRELALARRRDYPVSIIMADLDHFKGVNDTYGHLAGDEVLRAFGTLIKRFYRSSDICCRYGGEEFLVLLPDMSNDDAYERTEQLRAIIENTPVTSSTTVIRLTSSFGIATFPGDGNTRDTLIGAADRALYAAKKAGRNQVKCYSSSARERER